MEKEWCMCCALDAVARDGDSTCSKCRGKDAYGTSKDRPSNKHKVLYSEAKKKTASNTAYTKCSNEIADMLKLNSLEEHIFYSKIEAILKKHFV